MEDIKKPRKLRAAPPRRKRRTVKPAPVALPAASPRPEPTPPAIVAEPKKAPLRPAGTQPVSHRTMTIALAVTAVLAIGGVGIALHLKAPHEQAAFSFPAAIKQQAATPVYYPPGLPAGWSLDQASIRSSSGVVFYDLRSKQGNLHVSIQPKPKDFDFSQLKGVSSIGPVVIGVRDKTDVSIETPDAWVIMNGPDTLPTDEVAAVSKAFRRAP
jgi:hypothetical protein